MNGHLSQIGGVVAYDALAESLKLIASGSIEGPVRLSRRRRFVPLTIDVDGDVAVTVFMRRSVGCHEREMHLLHRRVGDWQLLGGGGGSDDLDELARPWSVNERGYFGRLAGGAWTDLNAAVAGGFNHPRLGHGPTDETGSVRFAHA